ncbi:MAG: hypothetical protein IPG74_14615 [Flavobacteriales bacterium]|nr:hypothetical protein [Flavobacteriales bacterium]
MGSVGYKVFGLEQLAIRAGNVLAFVLYAWMVWCLGGYVRDRLVRWCMWLALLLCPFLLEFFSLFRGYGLEMVFFVWALHALLSFARDGRVGQFAQVLLSLCLANASILALLPFWSIVLGLLAITTGAGSKLGSCVLDFPWRGSCLVCCRCCSLRASPWRCRRSACCTTATRRVSLRLPFPP